MNIFQNRPLAAALCLFLAAFFLVMALGVALPISVFALRILVLILLLLPLFSAAVLPLFRRRLGRVRLGTLILMLLFVALATCRAGGFAFQYRAAQETIGKTVCLTVEILECEHRTSGYTRYRVQVEEAYEDAENGERMLNGVNASLVLYETSPWQAGDRIVLSATADELTAVYSHPVYALADGSVIAFTVKESDADPESEQEAAMPSVTRAEDGEISPLRRLLLAVRRVSSDLSYLLRETISGDAGALSAAFLLGDRAHLPEEITRDFARAGISHLLALSGLHLSILVAGVAAVLGRCGLSRRLRALLTVFMTLCFLALTGFSMSASRAGVMLIYAALCGFFSRKSDGITTLFSAVAVLLLTLPSACFSVGLWMSFASVLSMLTFLPALRALWKRDPNPKTRARIGRVLHRFALVLLSSVMVSVVATVAVLPLLWLVGGELSLFSVPSNLLTVPFAPVFLILSLFTLLLCRIPFLSGTVAILTRAIAEVLLAISARVSEIRGVTVSLRYPFFGAVVLAIVLPTIYLLVFRFPPRLSARVRKWCLSAPLILPLLVLVVSVPIFLSAESTKTGFPAAVTSSSSGEVLVALEGRSGVLVDASNGAYNGYYEASELLRDAYVTEWSGLVLTHYHTRHVASVLRFCRAFRVHRVYLPDPATDKERVVMDTLIDRLSQAGIPYTVYARRAPIALTDDLTMMLSEAAYLERSVQPTYYFSLEREGERLTCLSASVAEGVLSEEAKETAATSEYLLYLSDGPKNREVFRVPVFDGGTKGIFVCGEEQARFLSPISLRDMQDCEGLRYAIGGKSWWFCDK